MRSLLPIAASCLLGAGLFSGKQEIVVTDGYGGPIANIGVKVAEALGVNAELARADMPRLQRIGHAASDAAETFARVMAAPIPNAAKGGDYDEYHAAVDCKDGSCKLRREVTKEVKPDGIEVKRSVEKRRPVRRLFGRSHK